MDYEEDVSDQNIKSAQLTKDQMDMIQRIQEKQNVEEENRRKKKREEVARKNLELKEKLEKASKIEEFKPHHVTEEWLEKRKAQQDIPFYYYRYNPKDVETVELGIANVEYNVTKTIKEKPRKKRGKKVKTTDEYGDNIQEPFTAKSVFVEEYNPIKILKSGGKIFDPTRIVNLEEEMPPNIRDYVEVPKKEYEYPDDYNGTIKYGDKVIFNVNSSIVVKGKIIEKKKKSFTIITENKKEFTVQQSSVLTKNNNIGDEVEFRVIKTYEVEGIVFDIKDGKFIIGGLDGNKYTVAYNDETIKVSKTQKYQRAAYVIPFAKDLFKNKIDIKLRRIVVQTLFDIFKKFIDNLETEKYPNLYDFGFTQNDELILKQGISGFDNQKIKFVEIKDDIYQGYWNYSFSFFPSGEEELSFSDEIYVPISVDKEKYKPSNELYYNKEVQNWIYTRYKNKCIEKLESDEKIIEKVNQKFMDMSDPLTIIQYLLNYLGDDVFDLSILEFLQRIKEKKNIILDDEYLFSIFIIDLEKGLHSHTNNPNLKGGDLAKIISSILRNIIMTRLYIKINESDFEKTQREQHQLFIKSHIKRFISEKRCNKYLLENPPVIDEEAKNFFDENILPSIRNRYHTKLILYINAKRKLDNAKKLYMEYLNKDQTTKEQILKKLKDTHSLINKDFSNLTPKGLEVLLEIKNYEKYCLVSVKGKKTFYNYLKKILTPIVFLKGELEKHTKFFQAKLSSRDYKIDELHKMGIEYLFPEFAMGIADGSISNENIISRFKDIDNYLEDAIISVIESYLAMEYLGIRTEIRAKRDVFNQWDKFTKNVLTRCKEQTNSGEGLLLKDVVVCYDQSKNLFTCNSVSDIIQNIRKHDAEKRKGKVKTKFSTTYGEEFIEKMRKRYNEEITSGIVQIESPKEEKSLELLKVPTQTTEDNKFKIVILYSNESLSYQQFKEEDKLSILKTIYPNIKFVLYSLEDDGEKYNLYSKKYKITKFPALILFKNNKKVGVIYSLKTENIEKLISETRPIFNIKEEDIIMESKTATVNVPYDDLGKLNLIELANDIASGEIEFPYFKLFMSPPETFVNHKTKAKLRDISFKNTQKQYKQNKGIIFYDSDYENIDILTNYFTDEARVLGVLTKDENNKNLIEGWLANSRAIAENAYKYAMEHKVPLDMKALREGLYMSHVKECTTFKISQAIAIYNEFKPTTVFDPFSGWGDRALGAAFSDTVKTYIGTDPNSLLVEGYTQIREFVKNNFNKKIIFDNSPIEDFDFKKYSTVVGKLSSPKIDLIFSSPPYFDYEIYSNEPTQSTVKYPTEGEWSEWFHIQTKRAFEYLKEGGHLVYYLGMCNTLNIPKDLIDYMKKNVPSSEYLGNIPTKEISRKKVLYFYVWRKKSNETKKW